MTHRKHKKIPAPSGAGIFLIEEVWVISLPQNQYIISLSDLRERVANIMQTRK